MFTGIIEAIGKITEIIDTGSNKTLWIASPLSDGLKVDQSVSHSGVCLTVEEIRKGRHRVTAIDETLKKTNLGSLKPGDVVNLERCLALNGRLDGHFVQGHVDTTGICSGIVEKEGSWEYTFKFPEHFAPLIIEKGSVCVEGISLTAFNVTRDHFTVAVIPYTYEHTNLGNISLDARVNLEFDLLGKYIQRSMLLNQSQAGIQVTNDNIRS
jgi:riboflavin synthase